MTCNVTVGDREIARAALIAAAMFADVYATAPGDPQWMTGEVLYAALTRGLLALERDYPGGTQGRTSPADVDS